MTRLATAALQRHFWFVSLSVGLVLVFSIVFASTVTQAGALTDSAALADGAAPEVTTSQDPAPAPAPPAQTPARDRSFIGETRCANCHEDQGERYTADVHSREWDPRTPGAANACESCHGPARAHFEDPEAPGLIKHFPDMAPEAVNETCSTCHDRREHTLWEGSAHEVAELSCVSCHSMHAGRSEPMLQRASETETCAQCHQVEAARIFRTSHAAAGGGNATCSTCHNPHGSANVQLLRTGNTVNELCVSCHTEKRGPFLWEHAPVRESCLNCHTPHGSNHPNLLVARSAFLCMQCHSYGGHVNEPRYNRVSATFGNGCVNCHITPHGSNHPSGAKQTR